MRTPLDHTSRGCGSTHANRTHPACFSSCASPSQRCSPRSVLSPGCSTEWYEMMMSLVLSSSHVSVSRSANRRHSASTSVPPGRSRRPPSGSAGPHAPVGPLPHSCEQRVASMRRGSEDLHWPKYVLITYHNLIINMNASNHLTFIAISLHRARKIGAGTAHREVVMECTHVEKRSRSQGKLEK